MAAYRPRPPARCGAIFLSVRYQAYSLASGVDDLVVEVVDGWGARRVPSLPDRRSCSMMYAQPRRSITRFGHASDPLAMGVIRLRRLRRSPGGKTSGLRSKSPLEDADGRGQLSTKISGRHMWPYSPCRAQLPAGSPLSHRTIMVRAELTVPVVKAVQLAVVAVGRSGGTQRREPIRALCRAPSPPPRGTTMKLAGTSSPSKKRRTRSNTARLISPLSSTVTTSGATVGSGHHYLGRKYSRCSSTAARTSPKPACQVVGRGLYPACRGVAQPGNCTFAPVALH